MFCSSGSKHYAIYLSLTSAVRTSQRQRRPEAHRSHLAEVAPDVKVGVVTMYRVEKNSVQLTVGASNERQDFRQRSDHAEVVWVPYS